MTNEINWDMRKGIDVTALHSDPNWKDCESLSLNNCGLTSLKGLPANDNLRELQVMDNRLTSIAEINGTTFPSLHKLDLSNNRLSDMAALDPLKSLKKLKHLFLMKNKLVESATDVNAIRKRIFEALPQLVTLEGEDRDGNEVVVTDDEDEEDDGEEDEYEEDDEDGVGVDGGDGEGEEEEEDEGAPEGDNGEDDEEEDEDEGDEGGEDDGEGEVAGGEERADEDDDEDEDEDEEEGDGEDELEQGPGLEYLLQDIGDDEEGDDDGEFTSKEASKKRSAPQSESSRKRGK